MNKLIVLLISMLFVTNLFCSEKELIISETIKSSIELKTVNNEMVYKPVIHPLGFSEDGYFAYLYLGENGGLGIYQKLVIVNLKTDKILIEDTFVEEATNLSELLNCCNEKIVNTLNRYNIHNNSLKMSYFPYLESSKSYFVYIDNSKFTTPLNNEIPFRKLNKPEYQSLKIRVSNKEKIITKNFRISTTNKNIVKIEGFIKSPYEQRIVIFTSGKSGGFENEYQLDIGVYGSHLTKGFKNKE